MPQPQPDVVSEASPNNFNDQPDLNYAPPPPADVEQTTTNQPSVGTSSPVPEAPGANPPTTFNQDATSQLAAIGKQGDIDQQKAQQEEDAKARDAALYGNFATQQQQQIDDLGKLTTESDRLRQADNAALMRHADSIAKQSIKDPWDHWWNSRSTGGKMAAVAGLIMGGIGQGLQMWGGNKQAHNAALDQLDTILKDDIDLQDANIKNQWTAYREMHGIADTADNERHFVMMMKQKQFELGQEVFKNQLQQNIAQSGSEVAKINGQQALLTLQERIDAERRAMGVHNEQLAAAQSSAQRALQEKREKAADAYATELRGKNYGEADVLSMVGQRYPEVARYGLNTGNFPTSVPLGPEGKVKALDTYTGTVKDINEAKALIESVKANPDQRLSKEQLDILAKHGIIIGDSGWFGMSEADRKKALDAASTTLTNRGAAALDLLHQTVNGTIGATPTPEGQTRTRLIGPDGKTYGVLNSKVDEYLKKPGWKLSDTEYEAVTGSLSGPSTAATPPPSNVPPALQGMTPDQVQTQLDSLNAALGKTLTQEQYNAAVAQLPKIIPATPQTVRRDALGQVLGITPAQPARFAK